MSPTHRERSGEGEGTSTRGRAGRVIAGVMLIVVLLAAASCSSEGDSTSTGPGKKSSTTTEASSATTEPADEPSEALVLKGTWKGQNGILELADGFSNSVALEGDLVGQGAFYGHGTPEGEGYRIVSDGVFNVRSPDLGEGLIAVQQWDGLATPNNFDGTGEVVGVSGAFAGMVGTVTATATAPGTGPEKYDPADYVFELQPAEPSPAPEATEPLTVSYETPSELAWFENEKFGGAGPATGDFVGSGGWTGYMDSGTGTTVSINVGTVEGLGEGTFITVIPTPQNTETWTVQAEFFGVSGALAGLQGTGTSTGTTNDSTGAFKPDSKYTFEVSSDELEGISWFRRADFYDLEEGPVTVDCRPDGLAHVVWGTDTYSADSSICTAAAHAGLITLEEGGEVTFAFTEGQDVWPASERNGVTSQEGTQWPRGFEFVEPS